MTNELLLKVFFFTNKNYAAYKKAKELLFTYYNNENYAELYFSLAINLNLINEVLSSDILIKSDNVKVHRIFFQKIFIVLRFHLLYKATEYVSFLFEFFKYFLFIGIVF